MSDAPAALLVSAVGMAAAGLCAGVLLGLVNDKVGLLVVLPLILGSSWFASWLASPFHSVAGDLIVAFVEGIPACSGAVMGYAAVGHPSRRLRGNSGP
ncbi:hypothetical protein [Allocatelliglobosispora scoriae]|nr:hypothetical protein [Allocatelliglobosispora scoriae]